METSIKGVVASEVSVTARDVLCGVGRCPERLEVQRIREASLVLAVRPGYKQERSKVD